MTCSGEVRRVGASNLPLPLLPVYIIPMTTTRTAAHKLTAAQAKALAYMAAHSGQVILPETGRNPVNLGSLRALRAAGLVRCELLPNTTGRHAWGHCSSDYRWSLTDAGRAAA